MKRLLIAALAAGASLSVAYAQDNRAYECRHMDDVRSVGVRYSMDEGIQSCSVTYKKSAAQPERELWHYQAHADMCQVRAEQFIKKLEGFGLSCSAIDKAAMKE